MTVEIEARTEVYKGWTTIHRLTLSDATGTFTREVEDHGSAVAVLPYDPERRTALLVRMPRAPVLLAHQAELTEVPAGLVEPHEDPAEAARREALEEAGVVLGPMEFVATVWSCPGLSTEQISLYLALYQSRDRTSDGGGLAEENENISVVELPLAELALLHDGQRPADMKTLALVQALRIRRPDLF